jgi:uncharacterized protein YxjI
MRRSHSCTIQRPIVDISDRFNITIIINRTHGLKTYWWFTFKNKREKYVVSYDCMTDSYLSIRIDHFD